MNYEELIDTDFKMSSSEELYPYIVPEIDGVEKVLSFYYRNSKGLSPDYSSYTHYSNKLFNKFDFVAREQFVNAYEHLKLVILDESQNNILHIPKREKYDEIFKDFRLVLGSENSGIDVSLSLKVMTEIIDSEVCLQSKPINFNLYFYPESKSEVRVNYKRTEILHDKILRIEKEVKQIKKDIDMKFEIMKNDLGMRIAVARSNP